METRQAFMDSLWKRIWLAGLADHVLNLTLDTAFFFLLSRQVEVPEARKAARSSAQNFLHLPQGKERQQKLNARATWTLYPPAWASLGRTFRRLASVESTMVVQVDNTTELELALPAQQNFPEEGLVFELAIIKDHRVSFTQASLEELFFWQELVKRQSRLRNIFCTLIFRLRFRQRDRYRLMVGLFNRCLCDGHARLVCVKGWTWLGSSRRGKGTKTVHWLGNAFWITVAISWPLPRRWQGAAESAPNLKVELDQPTGHLK